MATLMSESCEVATITSSGDSRSIMSHPGATLDDPTDTTNVDALEQPLTTTASEPDPQPSAQSTEAVPLSKNARKRLAKDAKWQAEKAERRAREKERKKEKRKLRSLEEPSEQPEQKKPRLERQPPFKARIVVDLGFDEKMNQRVLFNSIHICSKCLTSRRKSILSANSSPLPTRQIGRPKRASSQSFSRQ